VNELPPWRHRLQWRLNMEVFGLLPSTIDDTDLDVYQRFPQVIFLEVGE